MRYWLDKDDDKTNLIVVTDEAVYAEKMAHAACLRQVGELKAGKSPATVFGEDATHVVLRTLTRVQQSSDDDDIDFVRRDGKDEKTESIGILDKGIRDDVYAAVGQVTQGRFTAYEEQYSRPRAAFGTLVALTVFGFGTHIAAGAAKVIHAADYEAEGRNQGMKKLIVWVLDLLGPTGVWVIGGSICALLLFGLYNSLKAPPFVRVLQAEPYKRQGVIGLSLRYLALAAAWVLFFPTLFR
jgi:hypothetical protein